MSHTPAPWRQDGRLVIDGKDDAVAMVNVARDVDTAHADARLIAAAPDLLDAVKHLAHCGLCADGPLDQCDGGRAALAAIARAEGRS